MTDEQFEQFVQAYPAGRRQRGYMTQQLFLSALEKTTMDVLLTAAAGLHKVEAQYVPLMGKFLEEERWIQAAPTALPAHRLTEFQRLGFTSGWLCPTCGTEKPAKLRVCYCGQVRP